MAKFVRLSWHRGEFSGGQLLHEMGTGAAGGAVAGAIAGEGVGALPGAVLGGLFGGVSYGGTQLWYNTRSNEDKASWQAGDIQENTEQIAGWLTGFNDPELSQQAATLKTLGDQFKQYVDAHVHNDKSINLTGNAFDTYNKNPQMYSDVDMSTAHKDTVPDDGGLLTPDMGAGQPAPNVQPEDNQSLNPSQTSQDQKEFSFVGGSRRPQKFTRVAVQGTSLPGDVMALAVDLVANHYMQEFIARMKGKMPDAELMKMAREKSAQLMQQLNTMGPAEQEQLYKIAVSKGMPDSLAHIQEILGKPLNTATQDELEAITKIMTRATTTDEAKAMFNQVQHLDPGNYSRAIDQMFKASDQFATKGVDPLANTATTVVDDAAAQATKQVTTDALEQGATGVAEKAVQNAAAQGGKALLSKGWNLAKGGIAGAITSMIADFGLNKAEEFFKGHATMILEKSQDSLEALDEINKLVPNQPQVVQGAQLLARLINQIMAEVKQVNATVAQQAAQAAQAQPIPSN